MKKIIFLLSFIVISYNAYSQLQYCCEGFDYSYEITDDCCVNVKAIWPDTVPPCNSAGIVFQQYDSDEDRFVNQNYEWIEMGDTIVYKLCPLNFESQVIFRVRLAKNLDDSNQPLCSPFDFLEGYTQHTDTVSLESCCDCPEDRSDWFSMKTVEHPSCPDSLCFVLFDLNLPEEATCYEYLFFENVSTNYMSNAIDIDDVASVMNGFDLYQFSECISHGESRIVNLYLMQDTTLMDYCLLSDTVQCDTTGGCECENIEPCTPDCPSIAWEKGDYPFNFTSNDCPGCEVTFEYFFRTGCNGHQDLQITEMNLSTPGCDDCTVAELYGESMRRLIRDNPMGFTPTGEDPREDTCSTIWRLGMGGCWAKWLLAIFDYSSGYPFPIGYEVRWSQCDSSDCCFQEYLVCRHSDGSVSTSALGDPGIVDCQGKVFDYIAPCSAKCSWLQSVEGFIGPTEDTSGTHGKLINYPRTENYYEIALNTVVESDYVLFNIKHAEGKQCKISLFDINGNYIKEKEFNINSNLHHAYIKTNNLTSGVYVYSVELDGIKIFSNKINIVK